MNIKPQLILSSQASTMRDVKGWTIAEPRWSVHTTKDYLSQINRCTMVFGVNSLEDIPADIALFKARFPQKKFPEENFKSYGAFLAWRKKMVSILKHFHGVMKLERETRLRHDGWAELSSAVSDVLFLGKTPFVAIGVLALEARLAGLEPRDVSQEWITLTSRSMTSERSRAIHRATTFLEKARLSSVAVANLLPSECIKVDWTIRRYESLKLPVHLENQAEAWIVALCSGTHDEILDEYSGELSAATADVSRAALKKYMASAIKCGVFSTDCTDLKIAFKKEVFLAVLRDWISEPDPAKAICDRTKRSYASKIIQVADHVGMPTDFMRQALLANRNLKQGYEDAKEMSPDTKAMCRRLLGDRRAELQFYSLHIAFARRAKELLAEGPTTEANDHLINKLGILACFSAIALWAVPLRISNLRELRHRGDDPTFILPDRSGRRAYIQIPSADVKNRKLIKAHISKGPTQGLEIVEWYIDVIRPRLPTAAHSPYLFPGYHTDLISKTYLRDSLFHHTRALGIPMNPHNFRHALASLYLRDHPGEYGQAARLLGISATTVRKHYVWIDEEAELAAVQKEVAKQAGFHHGA